MTQGKLQVEIRIGASFGAVTVDPQVSTISGSSGIAAQSQHEGDFRWPNLALKNALMEIDKIQQGMGLTSGADSVEVIRVGRSGPMYGID